MAFIGEIGLDGRLKRISGILPLAMQLLLKPGRTEDIRGNIERHFPHGAAERISCGVYGMINGNQAN